MSTLSEIRDRCYQRANRVNATDRFPTTEVDQYINDSYKELWAILAKHSLIRVEAQMTITADGSGSYDLPSDFWSIVQVWRQDSNDFYAPLKRHSVKDRRFGSASSVSGDAYSYRAINESSGGTLTKKIELYPAPTTKTYYVVYIPVPATLVSDSDSFDEVLGWDEYIVNDVAIKMLLRDRDYDSVRFLKNEKMEIMRRIRDEAEMQELSETSKIENTRRRRPRDPADVWWARDGDDWL